MLVAPLDWGLGHATRCIPLINTLLKDGCHVILAGEGAVATLLQKEFPLLKILPLKGYRVKYSKSKLLFNLNIILQIPKIKAIIKFENKWLQKVVDEYSIDIVISDNRYGLVNKKVYSVFITHQLNIKTNNSFTEKILQKINYGHISNFDECWVPDAENEELNLGGELSHPKIKPGTKVKYIGALSRFSIKERTEEFDILVILSGPEPQRTILENIIFEQTKETPLKIVMVRGLPSVEAKIINSNITIHNYANASELNALIQSSKLVISRSGYSTVMDIAALQQKAIFIPTPGQTEQEYLAKYLAEKNYCLSFSQNKFKLNEAMQKATEMKFEPYPSADLKLLDNVVRDLLQKTKG